MTRLLVLLAILAGAPLAGAWLAGEPLAPYLDFPPTTRPRVAPAFDAGWFWALAAFTTACVAPFPWTVCRSRPARPPVPARFPRWGFAGAGLLAGAWLLAWTRLPAAQPIQAHTFTPLWLGYIVVVNALCVWRCGRSPLTHHTARYLALFPLSAAFWWSFEYLNRFARNWYYVGVDHFSPLEYFLFATLPFSTVLPAVLATAALLASFPRLHAGLERGIALRAPPPGAAPATLAAGTAALAMLAYRPDLAYPAVWLAPLAVLLALDHLRGRTTLLAPPARGDWREIWLVAVAALVCGLLWEMWNAGSLAHWRYAVPHVHRYLVFEMPLLGYAGYLPFGLTCAAAADFFLGRSPLLPPAADRTP